MDAASWGYLAFLGLCAVASIVLGIVTTIRGKPSADLAEAIHALERDLADLNDHINRREQRERTAKMRAGREKQLMEMAQAGEQIGGAPMTDMERQRLHKLELRARLRGRNVVPDQQ